MSRTFYADYVRHMARFYFRSDTTQKQHFKTPVDEANWKCCHAAAKSFNSEQLFAIYAPGDSVAENILRYSDSSGIPQDQLWEVASRFEKSAAKRRGLI